MSAEIEEGHGKTDVSCRHGSRWKWWPGRDDKGAWMQVVWASNCDCSDPPRPEKKEAGYVMLKEDEPLEDDLEDLDEDADDHDEAEGRRIVEANYEARP